MVVVGGIEDMAPKSVWKCVLLYSKLIVHIYYAYSFLCTDISYYCVTKKLKLELVIKEITSKIVITMQQVYLYIKLL